ncbi:MAG: hypothetical protein LBI04_05905 [Treponema sp.]|jgi:opacity protein-like surface antigen|nr:hypothetical protein [Treponema sp.]
MKKSISILVLLTLAAGGAFAIDMAAGGGLMFDFSGNNGVEYAGYYEGLRVTSFGAFGFFDFTYAEIDLYLTYGSVTAVAEGGGLNETADVGSMIQLGFSLLGKYPIDMSSMTLFPLAGISYNRVLSYEIEGISFPDAGEWLSQFGFLLGLGLDYSFTESIFLRAEGLFNIRLSTKLQDESVKGTPASTTWGMGPRIKVGIGYKF